MSENSQAADPENPWKLRVATYNIHGCIGTDGELDLPRVARVLKAGVPDVIGLNEVYRYFVGPAQDEELAQELGPDWTATFGKTINKPLAQYGNAVVTRLPVVSSEGWLLDDFPGQERRGLMRVTVRKGGRVVHVFCTHMGLNGVMRAAAAKQILEIMGRFSDGYCVLMGDFNETVPAAGLEVIRGSGLTDAWATFGLSAGKTFPSRPTLRRLDYIWLGDGLAAESCYVATHADARLASDHLPVFASLVATDDLENPDAAAAPTDLNLDAVQGALMQDDFQKVGGSETPPWWRRMGARLRGDHESGGFGGVAIAGDQHFWRQKSGGELVFERKPNLEGFARHDSLCVGARFQMIAPGDGWSFGLGKAGIRVLHDMGKLPSVELLHGDDVISSVSLTQVGTDPYSWNTFVIKIASDPDNLQTNYGQRASHLTLYINGSAVMYEQVTEPSDAPEDVTLWVKTDGGDVGSCEVFADDFVVWQLGTGDNSRGINMEALINQLFPARVIRKEDRGEKVWWLDLW